MIIREKISLAPYTTFRIGGEARYFVEIASVDELVSALEFAEKKELPIFILGAGSNVLVADDGFDGIVIHFVNKEISFEENDIHVLAIADAGVDWDHFVTETVSRGLWGIENLSGIPSSVGASSVQNIGAYGVEAKDTIAWVEVYDRKEKKIRQLSARECAFGYRDSFFKHGDGTLCVVVRVAFLLARNATPIITYKDLEVYHTEVAPITSVASARNAVLVIRAKKFPTRDEAGTAGSFFKNPIVSAVYAKEFKQKFPDAPLYPQANGTYKLSAAWILDHVLHVRGLRVGDVGSWNAQALIIVNYGHARACDVMSFVQGIISSCEKKIHLSLAMEVITIGKNFPNERK